MHCGWLRMSRSHGTRVHPSGTHIMHAWRWRQLLGRQLEYVPVTRLVTLARVLTMSLATSCACTNFLAMCAVAWLRTCIREALITQHKFKHVHIATW